MATQQKRVSSRIIPKHDIEANWNKAINFVPIKGEIIVYDADENYNYQRIKYGDGVTKVTELPFHTKPMNWNQNDEKEVDYIENRPVYEDIVEVDYTRLPYFSNSRYSVTRDPLDMGYCHIPIKLSLEEGQEYDVITMGTVDGIEWEEYTHKTLIATVTGEGETNAGGTYELPAGIIKLLDEEEYYTEIYVGVRFNTIGKIIKDPKWCIYFTDSLHYNMQAFEHIINGIPSTDYITKRLPAHLLNAINDFNPNSYEPQSGIAVQSAIEINRPITNSTLGDQHIKSTISDNKQYFYTEGIGNNDELKTNNKETLVDAVNEVMGYVDNNVANIEGQNLVSLRTDKYSRSTHNSTLYKLSAEDLKENAPSTAYSYNILGFEIAPKYDKKLVFVTTVYDGLIQLVFSAGTAGKYNMCIHHYNTNGEVSQVMYKSESSGLSSQLIKELKNAKCSQFFVVQNIETKEYVYNLSLAEEEFGDSTQWDLTTMTCRKNGLKPRVDAINTEYYTSPTLDSTGKWYAEQRILKSYNHHYALTVDEEGFIIEDVENTFIATTHNHNTMSQGAFAGDGYLSEFSTDGKMFYIHTSYNNKYKLIDKEGNEIISNCVTPHISTYNGNIAVINNVNNVIYLTTVDINGNIISSVPFDTSIYVNNHIIVGDYIYIFNGCKTYGGKINDTKIKLNESSLPIFVDYGYRLKLYKNQILVRPYYDFTNEKRCSWIPLKKELKFNESDADQTFNPESALPQSGVAVAEAVEPIKNDFNSAFDKVIVGGSKNLLDTTKSVVGFLNKSGGLDETQTAYNTSDFISVTTDENIVVSLQKKGTTYRDNRTSYCTFGAYADKNTFISRIIMPQEGYYTVPDGANFIRVSYDVSLYEKPMIEIGTEISTVYEEYTEGIEQLKLKDGVADIPTKVSELQNDVGYITKDGIYDSKPLALPQTIYSFVNYPIATYFRNILPYDTNDVYVQLTNQLKGNHYKDRWEYTPTQAETFVARYHIENHYSNVLNEDVFNIIVKDSTTKESLTVLVIGDSTVQAGVETQKMLDLATADGYPLTLLGTRGKEENLNQHEGRGGWTAQMYVNNASNPSGTVTNAFYNPTSETFDFAYYMAQQGYSGVDCVFIQLGINDLFGYKKDSDLNTAIETYLTSLETMINSIHDYDTNIKIVLNMIIPCTPDQDKFTEIYGMSQTTWRCRKNTYEGNIALMNKFGNTENIYISPYNATLDTVNNIPSDVHPSIDGYNQLGTQMYSFMRAIN